MEFLDGLKYDKVYCLHKNKENITIENTKGKLHFFVYKHDKEIKKILKKIVEEKKEELIIPYFSGDNNSKYMIFVQNLYWKQIDWKIFKHKNKMNQVINSTIPKKNFKVNKNEIKKMSRQELTTQISADNFIIKPTNKSSSLETFHCKSENERNTVQKKLSKSDQYVIEEYLTGNQFSLDFMFDWEKILLLSHIKQISFDDIIKSGKLSKNFIHNYWNLIEENFRYFLVAMYNTYNISKTEIKFLTEICNVLKKIKFTWLIHMEYKYDKKNKKIWFIERWARLWWRRSIFIKQLHWYTVPGLFYDVFGKKDISKREQLKWDIYQFKEKKQSHLVSIKTDFIKKISYFDLLKPAYYSLKTSFTDFLKHFYRYNRWIKIEEFHFNVKAINWFFKPSYKWDWSYFIYSFELSQKSFQKFKNKRLDIIEKVIFHNYSVN